ncbi:hypothetical protein ACQ4PT_029659 [Festuca glaucescens]
MAEEGKSGGGGTRVCVTGGAGFVGSWLVRKLLEAGYTVHATLRSIGTLRICSSTRALGTWVGESDPLLVYNDGESPVFEVVTLPCGLVAGDTVLSHVPEMVESALAPVTGREPYFTLPRILQRLLSSVPLVHVDDVSATHIFCMEQPSLSGWFLCAAAYPTIHDILEHYGSKFPHLDLLKE